MSKITRVLNWIEDKWLRWRWGCCDVDHATLTWKRAIKKGRRGRVCIEAAIRVKEREMHDTIIREANYGNAYQEN